MNTEILHILRDDAVGLLRQLIAIPSLSKEEIHTADCIQNYLHKKKIAIHRTANNVWCSNKYFDAAKPTILLNSHHDTVAPNSGYTKDPFSPEITDGKLYGLGSTDAGASLACLLSVFISFMKNNSSNIILYLLLLLKKRSADKMVLKVYLHCHSSKTVSLIQKVLQ